MALVRDVADFLKRLAADSGFVVTCILDGDICPQSKRDSFNRRYKSIMDRINSYFCRQSAMKIASKPETQLTSEEKKRLKIFNAEAKTLELSTRMNVPTSFKHDLESALLEIEACSPNRQSGGFVRREIIKAEFEADYLLAYRFRQGLSDLVYSTDSDLSALGGTACLSIRYFGIEKKQASKKKSTNQKLYNFSY